VGSDGCAPVTSTAGPLRGGTLFVASDGLLKYARPRDITRVAGQRDLRSGVSDLERSVPELCSRHRCHSKPRIPAPMMTSMGSPLRMRPALRFPRGALKITTNPNPWAVSAPQEAS